MEPILEKFIGMYDVLRADNLSVLADVYHPDIVFIDPLHVVEGLGELTEYFQHLYVNVQSIEFDITDRYTKDSNGFVYWQMRYCHPKLNSGNEIVVDGHSKLTFLGGKVVHHRDYFDVGSLLYRQIPILGFLVKLVDKRASDA
ncbi:nuclear transport factor 2 family protein [Pseudoalteromonas aurantia]|uniref:Transcriptional regulator n=1 Tax=Pseudoalteromonas aurantia TaxID=43654 RepID=A0A5S3V8Q1_9GAMM|nr:nuclear transport factor 2 family protein [Pseudoalteromonas aurantia]TMO64990.1 transcriptional regulator [Pseudoalteromonas aurantia]TMO68233.1 transcriptional regulator [Pseudoalteromonas aurantia]TMO72556.1 transcriptional regulator [Pseudoalteromonas aurantia]